MPPGVLQHPAIEPRAPFFAVFLLLALFAAPPAQAQNLAKVDPRALAMGGGYVAVADGYAALQWNPAGLWVSGRKEAAIVLGSLPLEGGRWVESLRVAAGFSEELAAGDAVATLASGSSGLVGERAFGVYIVSARFGGAIQQITYVDVVSRFVDDAVHIDVASLRTREYQFSGAHPFMQGRLVLGGSAKLVQAQGRLDSVPLDHLAPADLTSGELSGLARSGAVASEDTVFSVDVGVLLMASSMLRIGAVVKNLNAPGLEGGAEENAVSTETFRLPRQIRVGGMLLPHPQVTLTLDLDLSTDVFVEGARKRRELGGGIEWSGDSVAWRGGLLFDLQAIERRPMYTFGVGLSGETMRADLAGSWRPDRDGLGWIGALTAEF
ncbi:MAG: conjugal transfer protein TraF [Acidobacteria bacterium]|nr:conjugal transfer protein TraF [Acidobacteriota bacterium]